MLQPFWFEAPEFSQLMMISRSFVDSCSYSIVNSYFIHVENHKLKHEYWYLWFLCFVLFFVSNCSFTFHPCWTSVNSMSPSFFNWTYVQRLIDKQLTNGGAIVIQANLVWYLTIISNSGRNKRLLRSLPCTSHSCNPRLHLQLNDTTAPFGTTKALLLLHTPLGVLIL